MILKEYIVTHWLIAVEKNSMQSQFQRFWPYAPYLALSLIVLGPLLLPGFVLTMDMVFTPQLRLPGHVDNTWLLYGLLHLLDVVLPADHVQKIMLLSCLLLSGVGMHRLLLHAQPASQPYWRWAAYVGGTLYTVNPYVYDRLMAGQWGVWLGYALLPWFAAGLLGFVRSPDRTRALRLGFWLLAMSIVSIHSVGYAVVLAVAAILALIPDWDKLRRAIAHCGFAVGVFVVGSSYWLLPALTGQGRIATSLQTFTADGRAAFATVDAVGTGAVGAVLGLMGFWQERRDLYVQPIESYAAWGIVYVLCMALLVYGAVQAWRHQRKIAIVLLATAGVGVVLAVGAGAWLSPGYREPQKFVALLALTHCYFVVWGAVGLLNRLRFRRLVLIGVLLLPLTYTPTLLWGAAGQLRTTDYPPDWFQVRRILQHDPNGKVLVLPWHLYMSYSFSHDRIIANPAPAFYSSSVVVSDDPELPGVQPQTPDVVRDMVQNTLLPAHARGEPIAAKLRQNGFGYVLLNKDLEWHTYQSFAAEPGVIEAYDGATVRLYKLTK